MNIYIQIPYFNKHITPIFDTLAKENNIKLIVGLQNQGSKYRKGYDWDNNINDSLYIKMWDNKKSLVNEYKKAATIIGVHGIFPLYSNFLLVLWAILKNKRVWIFSEGLKSNKNILNKFLKSFFIRILNSSKVVFFELGNKAYYDFKKLGATNWKPVGLAYCVESIDRNNYSTKDKLSIIYIGQLIDRKRPLDLLEAILRIKSNKIEVNIFGAGVLELEIKRFIKIHNLENVIFLKGLVDRPTIINEMLKSDCLVLPSEYDGWGAVVNEAMECGLAVIVSSGVRAKKLVDEEYIFPVGDVKNLSERINHLLVNRDILDLVKIRNKRTIELYSPEQLVKKILKNNL